MDRKTENEKKKEYLREYNYHVRRIRRIETELAELRLMKISGSGNMDGMPHGSNQSDLSDFPPFIPALFRKTGPLPAISHKAENQAAVPAS